MILLTGEGSTSVDAGIPHTHTPPPQEQTPPGSRHPPEQTPPEQTPPRVDTPRGRACWEIRSTCRRYASYWNAILFWMDFKASVGHATKLFDHKSKEAAQQRDRKTEVLPCAHIPQLPYCENNVSFKLALNEFYGHIQPSITHHALLIIISCYSCAGFDVTIDAINSFQLLFVYCLKCQQCFCKDKINFRNRNQKKGFKYLVSEKVMNK